MTGSDLSYGDYLKLDKLLAAQAPLSDAHDEMLFIIQHQTTELWMRLLLHEIDAARESLVRREFSPAFKMLARISRIFDQMNLAWDVLRTMTPVEYSGFRDSLGTSSGFQSPQYRLIEFALGNRNRAMLKPHRNTPDIHALLEAELKRPSLYDIAIQLLADATGHTLAEVVRSEDGKYRPSDAVENAWITVYREPERHWDLYELAEKLVDLEDYFRRWRFNHVTTVERIIGMKQGTGGTSGVHYLRRMLETELFPELWRLRSKM
jgi:tryptophan 2,3-dioxygenase